MGALVSVVCFSRGNTTGVDSMTLAWKTKKKYDMSATCLKRLPMVIWGQEY